MAITVQTLVDGSRKVVVNIVGSADAAGTTLDISSFAKMRGNQDAAKWTLKRVWFAGDQRVDVFWDATANVLALSLAAGDQNFDFQSIGGIKNNAGVGVTGDVIITPAASANYSLVMEFTKVLD